LFYFSISNAILHETAALARPFLIDVMS